MNIHTRYDNTLIINKNNMISYFGEITDIPYHNDGVINGILGNDAFYFIHADGNVEIQHHEGDPIYLGTNDIVHIDGNYDSVFLLHVDGTVSMLDHNNHMTKLQLQDVVDISCGDNHAVFLISNGDVYGIGSNEYDQLHLQNEYYDTPTKIPMFHINKISCASNISMFLYGNIIHIIGDFFEYTSSKLVIVDDVENMYAGDMHALITSKNGDVYGIGNPLDGIFGSKDTEFYHNPKKLDITNIINISSKATHSIFLSANGTISGCGDNTSGQIIPYYDKIVKIDPFN